MPDGEIERTCANCGAPLHGVYCHRCGQKDLDLERPFFSLLAEWLGNLFAFDARVWRTLLPLLARPGFLTREYLGGRRERYVPPLRLYFFASVAMFLALAWSGYSIVDEAGEGGPVAVSVSSGSAELGESGWLETKIEALDEQPGEVVNALYRQRLAQTLILLALAFAVFTRVLFPRPHRRLLHHLVFSIHVHAAAFAGIVLTRLFGALAGLLAERATRVLGLVFFVYLLAYIFKALRLVHQHSRWSTAWRSVLLGIVYAVTLSATLISTLLLTAAFL